MALTVLPQEGGGAGRHTEFPAGMNRKKEENSDWTVWYIFGKKRDTDGNTTAGCECGGVFFDFHLARGSA